MVNKLENKQEAKKKSFMFPLTIQAELGKQIYFQLLSN